MEEMGLEYRLETLPFPPRVFHKDYLEINPLGTVPYLIDGDTRMTESSGASHYLVERYGPTPLRVDVADPEYGAYLNWLYYSDATITFPQTIFLRYTQLEPEERRLPQAAEDYRRFFAGRLRLVEAALADREFLCGDRFTIADVCVGYALHLASSLQLGDCFGPGTVQYWERLKQIPSYARASSL